MIFRKKFREGGEGLLTHSLSLYTIGKVKQEEGEHYPCDKINSVKTLKNSAT